MWSSKHNRRGNRKPQSTADRSPNGDAPQPESSLVRFDDGQPITRTLGYEGDRMRAPGKSKRMLVCQSSYTRDVAWLNNSGRCGAASRRSTIRPPTHHQAFSRPHRPSRPASGSITNHA